MQTPYDPYALPDMEETGWKYPVIVRDTRDREDPLVFTRLTSVWDTMTEGDYSVVGGKKHISCERKKLGDLANCTGAAWDRFSAELFRLRGYQCKALCIQGTEAQLLAHDYRSKTTPQSVRARLDSIFTAFGIPTLFFATAEEMALRLEVLACWYVRGQAKKWKGVELVELWERAK